MKFGSIFGCISAPQASGTVAAVRLDLRKTRGSELGGDGVQHSDPILHAAVRHLEHRLFQVADEQRPRVHHVPPLLRLRRRLADVRVRVPGLPGLGTRSIRASQRSNEDGRWMHIYGSRHRHYHRRRRVVHGRREKSSSSAASIEKRKEKERHDNSLPEIIIENSVDAPHPPSLVPRESRYPPKTVNTLPQVTKRFCSSRDTCTYCINLEIPETKYSSR